MVSQGGWGRRSDFVRRAAADRAAEALDGPTWMLVQPLRREHHGLHLAGRYTGVWLLNGDDCVTPAARERADQERQINWHS